MITVANTRKIRISVETEFLPEQSHPEQSHYFFAYHIRIENQGDKTVQLLTRHWMIKDLNGHTEEVRGEGVIGEQPVLEPGESFTYTSFCPLKTPMGSMEGSYQMITENGETFDAKIPLFQLQVEKLTYH